MRNRIELLSARYSAVPERLKKKRCCASSICVAPFCDGSKFIARGIVTEWPRPGIQLFWDLRGSVTPAKAGGVEPVPASPDARVKTA